MATNSSTFVISGGLNEHKSGIRINLDCPVILTSVFFCLFPNLSPLLMKDQADFIKICLIFGVPARNHRTLYLWYKTYNYFDGVLR